MPRTLLALVLCALALGVRAEEASRYVPRGEAEYAFVREPVLKRDGDDYEIRFETKGFCDATVVVEDPSGRIVRHLASGLLGKNPPPPFQKDTRAQVLHWDGKDGQGIYLQDPSRHRVRVSLGLAPEFERSLFYSPYKLIGREDMPALQAAPEGVYVHEGQGVDQVRLYGHDGKYVRTVYPFPSDKLSQVEGLKWRTQPSDGAKYPFMQPFYYASMLTAGMNAAVEYEYKAMGLRYRAGSSMAVQGKRLALAGLFLNRLATDGSSGGLPLAGPKTNIPLNVRGFQTGRKEPAVPESAAFSPDGRWLYLTGFEANYEAIPRHSIFDFAHCVLRVPFDGGEPELFAGSLKQGECGNGDEHFTLPTSVACDSQGRVYVSDYMNDRVQVFAPGRTLLKSIKVAKPAKVCVHHKTGELFVFSWLVRNNHFKDAVNGIATVPPRVTWLGPLENPEVKAVYDLPDLIFKLDRYYYPGKAHMYSATVDSWTEPPTIWLGQRRGELFVSRVGDVADSLQKGGLLLLAPGKEKLEVKMDFGAEALKDVPRLTPAKFSRQRLVVDPKNEKLYVCETEHHVSLFSDVIEVDIPSGRARLVKLPFSAEDLAFDINGLAHLRSIDLVARYDAAAIPWREVPFDYGDEQAKSGAPRGIRTAPVIAGIRFHNPSGWHQGGMSVSAAGHVLVTAYMGYNTADERADPAVHKEKPYLPRMYPGRFTLRGATVIHIWNKHGERLVEDAVPGLTKLFGAHLDANGNVYVMATLRDLRPGADSGLPRTNALMRFAPKKAKIVLDGADLPMPLEKGAAPDRPRDLSGGGTLGGWIEGEGWTYGGVGLDPRMWDGGNKDPGAEPACSCSNASFALDLFGRSFAPELSRFGVAVLDANGNLVTRVGGYGNVDEAGIGLVYPAYVAVQTDRRLFVADAGNGRVASVRLAYRANAFVEIK